MKPWTTFALGAALAAGVAAQERTRVTYELVFPAWNPLESSRLSTPADDGGGGVVLSLDDDEDSSAERLEQRIEQLLGEAQVADASVEMIQRDQGSMRFVVGGSPAVHKALRAAMPRLQRALDAATLRFTARLFEARGSEAPQELAQLQLAVVDGDHAARHVIRTTPWQLYDVDQTGQFPRMRPSVQGLNEGFSVEVNARRTAGDAVELRAQLNEYVLLGKPQVVRWPMAGEQTLPTFTRFSANAALRMRPGTPQRLAEVRRPDGVRRWLELELQPGPKQPPTLRDLCLELHDFPPESSVRWFDELDRKHERTTGGGGFSFEEEEEYMGSLTGLALDAVRVDHERWIVPTTRARRVDAEALLQAWDDTHPSRRVELAWGTPTDAFAPTAPELPLTRAQQVSVATLVGHTTRYATGNEATALHGYYTVASGPEGETPQLVRAPIYGSTKSGARLAVSPQPGGGVSLSWHLADPGKRELRDVDGHPVTVDGRWSWQGEAEVALSEQWALVGEAQRPDGALVALYARYAK